MRLSEQERSAAQADLDRLTGELVRLYQLREQLKLALNESGQEDGADATGDMGAEAVVPAFRLVLGRLGSAAPRDEAQRLTLRSQFQVIRGGLS